MRSSISGLKTWKFNLRIFLFLSDFLSLFLPRGSINFYRNGRIFILKIAFLEFRKCGIKECKLPQWLRKCRIRECKLRSWLRQRGIKECEFWAKFAFFNSAGISSALLSSLKVVSVSKIQTFTYCLSQIQACLNWEADFSVIGADAIYLSNDILLVQKCYPYPQFSPENIIAQPARDVPWTSPKGTLKVLTSRTSKGPSGNSQETIKKLMI